LRAKAARDEATVDAALCRRLSRRYRSSDHGAAWRLPAADDALLAQGELPDDDRQLSKITKLPLRTWCDYRPILQDFFYEGWKHKRIDAELKRMVRLSEKRAIAGQKGGLGSALARMRLENASHGRALRRAIAPPMSSEARAADDHSHPHQTLSLSPSDDEGAKSDTAPAVMKGSQAIPVSAELAALIARKSS
jgi:uncharacterized protein YdaU (DUF1376 family)